MKNLLYLLLFGLSLTLTNCSSDNDMEEEQDYTSFVFTINANEMFKDCVAGYKKDGKYKKIADLGDLNKGKYSPEIIVADNTITEIYIWGDWGGVSGVVRLDAVYKLSKNQKNIISPTNDTKGIYINDKSDPTQYPQ